MSCEHPNVTDTDLVGYRVPDGVDPTVGKVPHYECPHCGEIVAICGQCERRLSEPHGHTPGCDDCTPAMPTEQHQAGQTPQSPSDAFQPQPGETAGQQHHRI